MRVKNPVLVIALAWVTAGWSQPEGFRLVAEDAAEPVAEGQGSVVIRSSENSIIEWGSFSIGASERVSFEQGAGCAVLNRVVGDLPSSILGELTSNSKVFLLNPHGVLIGPDARIESAGFLAATLDVLNAEFLAQQAMVFRDLGDGAIVNLGRIHCETGDITLLARSIKNDGILEAPNGVVSMTVGAEILLKPDDAQRTFIRLEVPGEEVESVAVEHTGSVLALSAELRAAENPYTTAIRSSGTIEATTVATEAGRVYLVADEGPLAPGAKIKQTLGSFQELAIKL